MPNIAIPTLPFTNARANRIMQVSWYVPDIEAAVMRWRDLFGIGPFFRFRNIEFDSFLYRGKPGVSKGLSMAIAQAGGIQVEFVSQDGDDASAYRDLYAAQNTGLHHVAVFAENYEEELGWYHARGFSTASEGSAGSIRFSYVDTSSAVGFMVEILADSEVARQLFEKVSLASKGWDGARPLRDIDEIAGP